MTCLFWLKFLDPKRQVKFFFGCESGPLMSHKVLVHTSDKVLHPGARHDFQRHVESLVKHGQRETAAELWSAVAEVQHLPVPEVPVLDNQELGPMAAIVCTEQECIRCREHRGGYRFPWLGRWSRSAALPKEGADAPGAWHEWSSCETRLDLLQLAMHDSGWRLQDFLPPEWSEVLSRASRFPGCAPLGRVFEVWRTWQLGSPVWIDPFSVPAPSPSEALAGNWSRAHRAMLSWLDADPSLLLPRLEQLVVLSSGRFPAAWKWLLVKEFGVQHHLFGQGRPVEKLPKLSCNSSLPDEF